MDKRSLSLWFAIAGLTVAVVGTIISGVRAFGQLEGAVKALDLKGIKKARDEAVVAIRKEVPHAPIYGAEPAAFTMAVPDNCSWVDRELIPAKEGICYLTRVSGQFEGSGEHVEVALRGGSWYLRGHSCQNNVVVGARCWKWPAMSGDLVRDGET